ncbi:hypothetical protein B0J18DRAFT_440601 [Chaetomium sp. MPI-SDFR-AT-0129]|nr:hypothetical protein B0J18DRAFT_440601 [Chaetomium sp. MPI-SDFR-AT-0129]
MQLTTILSLFVAAASATPCPGSPRKFGIMALRSASPIHFASAGASQNGIALNLSDARADADCVDGSKPKSATFYIEDERLYLYGKKGGVVQQFVVDRSGMGQGVVRYSTKTESDPTGHLEVKGWAVDETGNLNFKGTGLQACPAEDGSWNIWLATVAKPAGQEGCLGFSARTVDVKKPVQCTYSNYA